MVFKYLYCDADYPTKNLTHCGINDKLGMNRPLLKSRICDGVEDCPNGVDESILGNCKTGTLNETSLQQFDINLVYKPQSLSDRDNDATSTNGYMTTIFFMIILFTVIFTPLITYKFCDNFIVKSSLPV